MERNLLDDLGEMVGCNYLSDLRLTENYKRMVHHLEKINEKLYPERQWRDAINYILGDKRELPKDGTCLKEYLCREMKNVYKK